MKKTQMIILAGGVGQRFGGELPKQFTKIAGKTIIEHTLEKMEQSRVIDSVIVVINQEFYGYMNNLVLKNDFQKVKKIIMGGKTRQESSYAGISACDEDTENVLFHDAIRPFVSEEIIKNVVNALEKYEAVDVAIPCADTIIQINDQSNIEQIPKRKKLMRGQTPQGFSKKIIEEAYRRFLQEETLEVTDDCGIVKHYDLAEVHVVRGEEQNIKITYKEDAYLADKLFQIHSIQTQSKAESSEQVYSKLQSKVGVIFGDSSGIGSAIKEMLVKHNCQVYGFSRKNTGDITKPEQVKKCLEEVCSMAGRIDYVINTAGELAISKLENMSYEKILELVQIDYIGAINVTKEALPFLKETKGSLVLFTSSSYTRGRAMYSIYSSTKAAVVNFAQAVADEVYENKIRINVMNPERTNTPMRRKNFGLEPEQTLLSSEKVAWETIKTLTAEYTGQVIDVRRE